MTPTVVYYVIGLFALRSFAAAVLGPRLPGFASRKTLEVPAAIRDVRIRRLRWLNAVLAVVLVALGVGLHAADQFLSNHAHKRAAAGEAQSVR
jgi:hypothetical protein